MNLNIENDFVYYVPNFTLNHYGGNIKNIIPFNSNLIAERGTINSVNDKYVFVNYYYLNGQKQTTAKSTNPEDLYFEDGTCVVSCLNIFKTINDKKPNEI